MNKPYPDQATFRIRTEAGGDAVQLSELFEELGYPVEPAAGFFKSVDQ